VTHLKAGYVLDERTRDGAHRQGRNYWWAYIAEVLDRLGLTAVEIPAAQLPQRLHEVSLILLGPGDASSVASELDGWVRAGGTLIACSPEGLDALFGNEFASRLPQPGGEFSVSSELLLQDTAFTTGIHSPVYPDKPLLIASPIRTVKCLESVVIGQTAAGAVITGRSHGEGWAFYFGFDLAQTFWVIQQGRPVDADHDGDGYWRTPDGVVIEDREPEIAYTDELLFLLQNMVGLQPHPLIHQLPPQGDAVPDVVLYYGGDDEGDVGLRVPAAAFMQNRGLPYHINCMSKDGEFALGPEEAQSLAASGTEVSLHYNFMDGFAHPGGFEETDVESQTKLFLERFGRLPVCANCHWCRWTGWAEPALWMMKQGVKADNSFIHRRADVLNPVNSMGFSFGTSYPFFFWTDHTLGNRRIEFLELPIIAYELGYEGDRTDSPQLERALTLARHYQSTMNFFYHPFYIVRDSGCRAAVDRLLSLIEEQRILALHSTPDGVARWWLDRSNTRIEDVKLDGGRLSFLASTPSPSGFIARIPLGSLTPSEVGFPHRVIEKFGRRWLMLVLPEGETQVEVVIR
jgi:hypothetical protein